MTIVQIREDTLLRLTAGHIRRILKSHSQWPLLKVSIRRVWLLRGVVWVDLSVGS